MIGIFLRHYIFEKCIDLIFDGISKAFKKPELKYEILNVKVVRDPSGLMFEVYTIKYHGEIHKYTTSRSDELANMFVRIHGYSKREAEKEISDMNLHAIESMLSGHKNKPSRKLVLSKGKNGAIARLSISKTAKNNV